MSFIPRLAAGIALTLIIGGCDAPAAPNASAALQIQEAQQSSELNRQLAAARAATAKYQNVSVARADGYVDDGFGCFSDPELGGMGWHLINDPLHADAAEDPLRPELLVYEVQKNGGLKLVALEYEVFQADWWNAGNTVPPSLFGQEFEALTIEGIDPIFALHVWAWLPNPSGIFAPFNPNTACP
jgi:hypothetical protein